jgi:long-chain fatty acid transport protein
LLLLPASAAAQTMQTFEEYGVGPRDSAMGNAFTGVAEGFAAAFYNPAGLSQTEGFHLTLGYKFIAPEVTAKLPGYSADHFTGYPQSHFGMFGLATDLNAPSIINPKYTEPFTFGVAFAITEFLHSYTNYYDQYTPYFFRYQDRPIALLPLYVTLGIKFASWFSIGGGIVVAPSATYIDARVHTDLYLPKATFNSQQGLVNRAHSIVKPLAGILFRIPLAGMDDRLRVGLTWRDEVTVIDGRGHALNLMVIHIPGVTQPLKPIPPMNVPIRTQSGFTPMQAAFGLAVRATRGTLISTDTIWKRWHTWTNYFFTKPDPPFHDTFEQRVGVEQTFFPGATWLESWTLRGGWYYQPTPTPPQNNEWNILDNDTHVFTAGFGLRFDRVLGIIKTPINFDAGFQVHYLIPEHIENQHDRFPPIDTGGLVYSGTAAVELAW